MQKVMRLVTIVGLALAVACSQPGPGGRVIVLGFDGIDYELTRELIAKGRLPNFAKLATGGTFAPLGTSIPPQSPVAWSTFITGLDPGGHGIFDFIHRDPKTMVPYLSTTRTEPAGATIRLGKWAFPLTSPGVELLRRGQAFWEQLEARGVDTTIIRMPANFPPSGTATRELSGMGTPDLLGTYGTYSLYTSEPYAFADQASSGGVVYPVDVSDGVVRAALEGPNNPYLVEPQRLRAEFTAYLDVTRRFVKLVVGDEERLLAVGEWSDWVPVSLTMMPTQSLPAICRFYVKQIAPDFALYVSPLNIDPLAPAMRISTPDGYAGDLAHANGRFYTLGIPEETKAFKAGVLNGQEFLAQAGIAGDENRRQFTYVLDHFEQGFLFYYFGNVDQVSHMMWRPRDPKHPAYDQAIDRPFSDVVEQKYVELDGVVAEALSKLRPDDLLIVMSDHGFASWRRVFHLNNWLRDNGYLSTVDPARRDGSGLFENVDWSRTRAYGLGLNGLYLNVAGRERNGIVDAARRAALVDEIAGKLLAVIDPSTGLPAVTRVYRPEQVYDLAGFSDIVPDLIVGYAKGTRVADESALGGLSQEVLTDNRDPWSGDHCMDHATVPGILLTNRPLRKAAPTLRELGGAILEEFGIRPD